MTEEIKEPSELELLKKRADLMGVKYHSNIGVEKLKGKIEAHMESNGAVVEEEESPEERMTKHEKRMKAVQKASKLVRVRITCMNPAKKEWEGEIFTAANGVAGTFRKYVPFGVIWHVPQIIYNMIDARKFQQFYNVRDDRGNQIRKSRMVKEFGIELLPQLTKEELKKLATEQAARHSIDEE